MPAILLASSSPYRRDLLARLHLPFHHLSPNIDESRRPGESPESMVQRLARSKAEALSEGFEGLIIGSDQVAVLDGQVLGKPLTYERAKAQLMAASDRTVTFLTGLALVNTLSGRTQVDQVPFEVEFRQLSEATIERYLRVETPLDCAGSFKAEGLGISLFRRTRGEDATSLVGLPLIRLVDMLLKEGIDIP